MLCAASERVQVLAQHRGRELCALARVNISSTREPSRSQATTFPVPWSPAHPPAVLGPRETPVGARCVDPWRSASRLGVRSTRPGARDVPSPRPRDCAAYCRGHRAPAFQRRSLWLDQASARRALAVPPRGISGASATTTTSLSVLARNAREVEAAAQRGRVTPAVRTKFQAIALLLRDERARVRAAAGSDRSSDRAAQAPGRHRDHPGDDRRPGRSATGAARRGLRRFRRGPVAQAGDAAGARHRAGARRDRAGGDRDRSRWHGAAGRAAVGGLPAAGEPLSGPRLLRRSAAHLPSAPPGQLGTARPAAEFLRARRRGRPGVHGAPGADGTVHPGGPGADAAPGAGGRRRRCRSPDVPARRRAGPGQDGRGAARRGSGERLPAARRRAERRQDQLGP